MTANAPRWWESGRLLFAVGIEDTFITQTRPGERELDEYELTGHYRHWESDIELIAESGATQVRWGVPWHLVNPARDVWEWEWLDRVADKLEQVGVTPIVDLMHYGTPLWLEDEFFNPQYPELVAEYARMVARRYGDRWQIFTPMNEPILTALYCGYSAYWPPYGKGDRPFVRMVRALQRGIVLSQRAIVDELGDAASFVHVEASFRFVADQPDAQNEADFLRHRAFVIQDLVTGRVTPEHPLQRYLAENGFSPDDFAWGLENLAVPDVMGVNYYPAGQTELVSVAHPHSGGPEDFRPRINAWDVGLEDVLRTFASRYEVPVFLTETSHMGTDVERESWLNASLATVHRLRQQGVSVVGYTWWSIIDMVEWTYRPGNGPVDDYLLKMGLWELQRGSDGEFARARTPLADQFRRAALAARTSNQEVIVTTLVEGESGESGPLYTRMLATDTEGPNAGAIFLTAELYRDEGDTGPVFPIWRSIDGGARWDRIASVADTAFGVGNRYQPTLFELDRDFGGFSAGTLLLAGSSIPADLSSTTLVLYASENGGHDWRFISVIDSGGPAIYDPGPDATTSAVWEPDLFMAGALLVCAYADERYKSRSMLQVLVHRTTADLRAWSDAVLDFGVDDSSTRPGMFVGTGQLPDGSHRGVFELVGPPGVPVNMARSSNGLDWGTLGDLGKRIETSDGLTLSGSPNIAWRSVSDGSVSDGSVELLVTGRVALDAAHNADGGVRDLAFITTTDKDDIWREVELPIQASRAFVGDNSGYSQSVVWAPDGALVQATTVRNARGSHDIVVARALPLILEPES